MNKIKKLRIAQKNSHNLNLIPQAGLTQTNSFPDIPNRLICNDVKINNFYLIVNQTDVLTDR